MITIFENVIKAFRWTAVDLSSPDMIFRIIKKNAEPRMLSGSFPQTHKHHKAPWSNFSAFLLHRNEYCICLTEAFFNFITL